MPVGQDSFCSVGPSHNSRDFMASYRVHIFWAVVWPTNFHIQRDQDSSTTGACSMRKSKTGGGSRSGRSEESGVRGSGGSRGSGESKGSEERGG